MTRLKLIEVTLPLEAINRGCAEDKNRKTGHIRNLHKWFAPMPLPAWRTMLLAAVADACHRGSDSDGGERKQLLRVIESLAPLDSHLNPEIVSVARACLDTEKQITIVDPFCGGGSTIVEAQRLGFETVASDLNPIPVLITSLLCRAPQLFRRSRPISGSDSQGSLRGVSSHSGVQSFCADLRFYAECVGNTAWERLKDFYPSTSEGHRPFAWRWAWSFESPHPAALGRSTPLVSDWRMSKGRAGEVWIAPVVRQREITFKVSESGGPVEPTTGRTAVRCAITNAPIPLEFVREEGRAGRLVPRLLAVAAKDGARTVYGGPEPDQIAAAEGVPSVDVDDIDIPEAALSFRVRAYGINSFSQLFTPRQRLALAEFAGAIRGIHKRVVADAINAGLAPDGTPFEEGGCGARAYADAVCAFLSLCLGKMAQSNSVLVRWFIDPRSGSGKAMPSFDRHAVPMVWDFVETNPFGGSVGDWIGPVVETALRAFQFAVGDAPPARVVQKDARELASILDPSASHLIATDPPYYANIGYADLSDYFYLWVRTAAREAFPKLFATTSSPKLAELIASPYRHGGSQSAADRYFRSGFRDTFLALSGVSDSEFPLLIVYALKQTDNTGPGSNGTATGWEVFLEGLLDAGLAVTATWPIRTTTDTRSIGRGTNSLASAIVVVCRRRSDASPRATRSDFVRHLRAELPAALSALTEVSVAPVDLAQAAIGPGIRIYSSYSSVIEPSGQAIGVREALRLINQLLDEHLSKDESDLDALSRFAVTWFASSGFDPAPFGKADLLAKAKNISIETLVELGVARAGGGTLRLLKRTELSDVWLPDPSQDSVVWLATQQLVRTLEAKGELDTATLIAHLGAIGSAARNLAYRLYSISENRRWVEEARAYNALVASWPELERLAARTTGAQKQLL
ncbi:MAG: DUF1156 domain-containing protein [Deltaproteobacteria bacterium]|nr:DUF1156 domain-containing protein [Deltaproteobacteria bacterium]